jgi:hypothetical protein
MLHDNVSEDYQRSLPVHCFKKASGKSCKVNELKEGDSKIWHEWILGNGLADSVSKEGLQKVLG